MDMEHGPTDQKKSDWEKKRDEMKTQWVVAVLAFWVSAAVLILVYFLNNEVNLILVSVVCAMMMLGVWLKARFQLHLRKEPGGREPPSSGDDG